MEVSGQGCGTGNGQDYELTEHIPERRGAWCILGQEMTFSRRDAGTSSFMNFLGGHLPGPRSRAEMGPDPVGEGPGEEGWDRALLAGIRVLQSSGLLTSCGSGLSRCVTHLGSSSGTGRAAQA